MMSEPSHQHPVAAITKVLDLIRGNLVTIIILLFVGSGGESNMLLYSILGGIVVFGVMGVVGWLRFTYQVVDDELRIKQGIFVRKNLYMSKDRIQVIDISAGVIQRIFGLVSVEVKTAGSTSKEAKISAIERSEANRIKQLLRNSAEELKIEETDHPEAPNKVYRLGMKDLVIAACTSGSFGIALSIVGGAFSQVDQIIDEEQMVQFFETAVPASVGVSLILSIIIAVVVISWLLSFLGTFIKYFDFQLTVKDDELLIQRGLFEQTQLTIPFNRIQAIQIKEELLRQPFGYASLILESAGYGDEQANSTILFPLLKLGRMHDFIEDVIPDYQTKAEGVSPPPVALRRYLLRMVWASLVVIIPLWLWVPYGIYSWILLAPALILGFMQYRDARIGTKGDRLVLRSRMLSRTTAVVKKHRVQAAATKQNPFQRRLDLTSYALTVASGNSGRTFSLRDLSETAGTKFLEWSSASGREVQAE